MVTSDPIDVSNRTFHRQQLYVISTDRNFRRIGASVTLKTKKGLVAAEFRGAASNGIWVWIK